jgi:methylase of polypeptide subunit release factors
VGAVGLEVGAGQAGTVAELVRRAGFERVEIRPDLAGIERVVVGL